jgi:hypothetical protein
VGALEQEPSDRVVTSAERARMSGYAPNITEDVSAVVSVDRGGKHGLEALEETLDPSSGDFHEPTLHPGASQG